MNENLEKVEALSQRLVQALSHRNPPMPELNGPGQDLYARAAASYWQALMENPGKIYEQQLEYWGKSVRHFMEAQQSLLQGHPRPTLTKTIPTRWRATSDSRIPCGGRTPISGW